MIGYIGAGTYTCVLCGLKHSGERVKWRGRSKKGERRRLYKPAISGYWNIDFWFFPHNKAPFLLGRHFSLDYSFILFWGTLSLAT